MPDGMDELRPAGAGSTSGRTVTTVSRTVVLFDRDRTACICRRRNCVLEIVSPGDESWAKLDFYAAQPVEELLIVDPREKTVSWTGLERGEYKHSKRSRLIELGAAERARRIAWP
jgi:hypothetical protein